MTQSTPHQPRSIPQVMVSSTFTDLEKHRAALIEAIHAHKLHANVMEDDSARLVDVIDASLQKVRDSAAYIGVIGLKYGQTPECPRRNPSRLSITELEFNEAQSIGRPILLFIMSDDHPVKKIDIEKDPENEKKLNAFRERAKKVAPDSEVNRIYAVFDSLENFKDKLGSSLTELSKYLDSITAHDSKDAPHKSKDEDIAGIPAPPALYAAPNYIGRYTFIGRKVQLESLCDWARPSDSANVLLFEAIGGNGKSMLTWEWTTKHAPIVRADWAGRFWYSFYEKGAVMRQFCQHALAYMTEQPLEAFEKKAMADMKKDLLVQLHRRPWLLVLDGLERVLVAYHRIDAADVPDEEVNRPADKILDRHPCDAIRDEDTELLRALAAAAPSKILISSRLTPRALLNNSDLPLPGVKLFPLPGLDEADAEQLLRSCGVRGTSSDIRYYLTNYCGNHPLVIGVLAGLINSPGPHRGNFDAWAADPAYGARLNLASLDLVQSRNHILRAAIEALEPASRQLLATLALLSYAVGYETVAALNPHAPPEPDEVKKPEPPEQQWDWESCDEAEKAEKRQEYKYAIAKWEAEPIVKAWFASAAYREAPTKLAETIQDIEDRGLLQYEPHVNRYDLHPVVRGIAAGSMKADEKERYGQRVVDYCSAVAHDPYETAESLEDLRPGLDLVQTLIKLGRLQEAADNYVSVLCFPLLRMEHDTEVVAVTRPFFRRGWSEMPREIRRDQAVHLMQDAAIAFAQLGRTDVAVGCRSALIVEYLEREEWDALITELEWLSGEAKLRNPVALEERLLRYGLELTEFEENPKTLYRQLRAMAYFLSRIGKYVEADSLWERLRSLQEPSSDTFKADTAKYYAMHMRRKHCLTDEIITKALQLAEKAAYDRTRRSLYRMRGLWQLERSEWALAAESFDRAMTLARERRLIDETCETGLVLAKFQLGRLAGDDARRETERLAQLPDPEHHTLARLYQAIGDFEQAKQHALKAYISAWADGEPYVNRSSLTKATELLAELGVPVPQLSPYDSSKDEVFPWEADLRAAINRLHAKKRQRAVASPNGRSQRSPRTSRKGGERTSDSSTQKGKTLPKGDAPG